MLWGCSQSSMSQRKKGGSHYDFGQNINIDRFKETNNLFDSTIKPSV